MTRRNWTRLDRVNRVVTQVLADELELIDDDRLELVTVTGARVERDFRRGVIWISALSAPATEDEVATALSQHRPRLQAAIGRQLRLKRTPELSFGFDPAIAVGTRVEDILRDLHRSTGAGSEPAAQTPTEED